MSEKELSRCLEELAFSVDASGVLKEISREYSATGAVSPEKIAEVLGDVSKPVTMETAGSVEQLSLG